MKILSVESEQYLVMTRRVLQSEARDLLLFALEEKEEHHKVMRMRRLGLEEFKRQTEEVALYIVELEQLYEKLSE